MMGVDRAREVLKGLELIGADATLCKPFDTDHLLRIIDGLVKRRAT